MQMLADLYFAHPFWVWLAVAGAILAVEVATGSGYLLWPAASAAAIGVLSLFVRPGLPLELLAFAGLTIVTTLAGRHFFPRMTARDGPDINDTAARLIGHRGRTAAAFSGGVGRVFVDGKEWAASLEAGDTLGLDQAVEVTGIVGGARLTVRAL